MDRRLYQRINIDAEGVFILDNETVSPREFSGIIENISEGGIKITFNKDAAATLLPYISKGEHLHFSAADDYSLFNREISAIISGKVEIIRKDIEDDLVSLGCKFKQYTNELSEYVSNKKLSSYMNAINSFN